MDRRWTSPTEFEPRHTTEAERARLLVDVLLLTDALPPVPHRDLTAPPFRVLCDRH